MVIVARRLRSHAPPFITIPNTSLGDPLESTITLCSLGERHLTPFGQWLVHCKVYIKEGKQLRHTHIFHDRPSVLRLKKP